MWTGVRCTRAWLHMFLDDTTRCDKVHAHPEKSFVPHNASSIPFSLLLPIKQHDAQLFTRAKYRHKMKTRQHSTHGRYQTHCPRRSCHASSVVRATSHLPPILIYSPLVSFRCCDIVTSVTAASPCSVVDARCLLKEVSQTNGGGKIMYFGHELASGRLSLSFKRGDTATASSGCICLGIDVDARLGRKTLVIRCETVRVWMHCSGPACANFAVHEHHRYA
jgi:hypothetical protein